MGKGKRDLKKEYAEHPENFAHIDDIVMCVKIGKDGNLDSFVNINQGNHIQKAIGVLICDAPFARQAFKAMIEAKNQPAIITPGNNGKNRIGEG